jgi:hypothetical protein
MTGSGQGGDTNAETPVEARATDDAGAPHAAGGSAQPTPDAAPVSGKVHRYLAPVLLVLATVVGIGATFALWVNRQALNTSNWSSTSEDRRALSQRCPTRSP